MKRIIAVVALLFTLSRPTILIACTIFSAKDDAGNVWVGNNEDAAFSFRNYINVFPRTKDSRYGYYTISRDKIENGSNAQIAGGMNEAGLFFDFNATDLYPVKDFYKKKPFPAGDDAILSHLLKSFSHVEEVVSFFETYWFQFGFRSAQMHLADKYGHFAIISPTGSQILKNEPFQVSTNFDICSHADSSNCWRFPIVTKALQTERPSLESFRLICEKTAQGRYTNYSTISNLKTGEIVVYFAGEYSSPYRTTLQSLLKKGKRSYSMEELFPRLAINTIYTTYKTRGIDAAYTVYTNLNLSKKEKDFLLPNFVDYFVNDINNYDIDPFLTELLNDYPAELDYWLVKSAIERQKNHPDRSKELLTKAKEKFPQNLATIDVFKKLLNGEADTENTASFILTGHEDAHFAIVKCKSMNNTFTPYNNITFMTRQKDKWQLNINLPVGVYDYVFVVDGKEMFDKNTPVKTIRNLIGENLKCHQVCIGLSEKTYPVNVEIEVPAKEDEVYIVGNQEAIFKAPLILMKKTSDFKRMVSVNVHLPATFKFVTGGGGKEAIVQGAVPGLITINSPAEISSAKYKISSWK